MEKIEREFLIIPDQVIVGYKKYDSDECKYGFVTYHKNSKIAKEASWNLWRDEKISPDEFENKPTRGFIITGEQTWWGIGWAKREYYFRVLDPRGFMFDIESSNLLEIIKYCTCLKGGEIDGEFVYSWDGASLLLLPTNSSDYIATRKMESDRLEASISWSSLVPGIKYRMQWRSDSGLYYIGHLKWKQSTGWYDEKIKVEKRHTFLDKQNQTLIQIANTKEILYPSKDGDRLTDIELNAVIEKFKETASGKPDNKIDGYVIKEPTTELLEKAKRILVDKVYLNSSSSSTRYTDNQIRMCSLSDNKKDLTTQIISVSLSEDGGTNTLHLESKCMVSIKDDDTILTTSYPTGWIELSDKDLSKIYKEMIPCGDNSIMFEIGGSLYSSERYGAETPYSVKGSTFKLK